MDCLLDVYLTSSQLFLDDDFHLLTLKCFEGSSSLPTIRIVEFNRLPAKGSSKIFVVWKILEKIENMLELRRFSWL